MQLLLASRNDHKRREFERLLGSYSVGLLPDQVTLPPEDGNSYAENALIKARTAAAATGQLAFADDSGIEAEAIGWQPGIYSARFAGEQATDAENLQLLRDRVPAGTALRYMCVIALVDPTSNLEQLFYGQCDGQMAAADAGSKGFGYDPVFIPHHSPIPAATMAELSDAQKDQISHRGIAARAMAQWLNEQAAG